MKHAAFKSFRWLVDQLSTFFNVQPQEMSAGLRDKNSLVGKLEHGLTRCISYKNQSVCVNIGGVYLVIIPIDITVCLDFRG